MRVVRVVGRRRIEAELVDACSNASWKIASSAGSYVVLYSRKRDMRMPYQMRAGLRTTAFEELPAIAVGRFPGFGLHLDPAGFLPERYGCSTSFETMPSRPMLSIAESSFSGSGNSSE